MVTEVMTETPTATVWDRLEDSAQWTALTLQQRVFLAAFLAGAGAVLATKTAYHAKNDQQAKVMSYEVSAKPAVVDAIAIATGATAEPTREELIAETRRQLRRAVPGSISASRLNAQLISLTAPEKTEQAPEPDQDLVEADTKFEVGATVEQDGHRYKIVAQEIS
jgi:hypothetical protein